MKVWVKYENGLEAPVDYEPAHGYTKVQFLIGKIVWNSEPLGLFMSCEYLHMTRALEILKQTWQALNREQWQITLEGMFNLTMMNWKR